MTDLEKSTLEQLKGLDFELSYYSDDSNQETIGKAVKLLLKIAIEQAEKEPQKMKTTRIYSQDGWAIVTEDNRVVFCSPAKLRRDAIDSAAYAGYAVERYNDNSDLKLRWVKCQINFPVLVEEEA